MVFFRTAAILLAGLTLFFSCHPCDPPLLIDNGNIPDSILDLVPYQSGKTYSFQHSGGLVIRFSTARQSREEWLRCERCCLNETKFEVNSTTLTPDYPIFNFGFELSNPDTVHVSFTAIVGYYWFQIPVTDDQSKLCDFADSVLMDHRFYQNVYKIKSNYGSAYDRDTIFADSLYYSYQDGIIQVIMSNGEKYTIHE